MVFKKKYSTKAEIYRFRTRYLWQYQARQFSPTTIQENVIIQFVVHNFNFFVDIKISRWNESNFSQLYSSYWILESCFNLRSRRYTQLVNFLAKYRYRGPINYFEVPFKSAILKYVDYIHVPGKCERFSLSVDNQNSWVFRVIYIVAP